MNKLRHSIASDDIKDAARAWIDKLSVKNGAYPPDSYPNPGNFPFSGYSIRLIVSCSSCIPFEPLTALAYHNAQLQASAFREQYDPDSFEDLTEPKYDMIHKVLASYFRVESNVH